MLFDHTFDLRDMYRVLLQQSFWTLTHPNLGRQLSRELMISNFPAYAKNALENVSWVMLYLSTQNNLLS
jgi:hypothetical protein